MSLRAEDAVDELDAARALADGRGDALDAAGAHVADRTLIECARPALERELTEAKAEAARIRDRLGKLGGGGSGGDAAPSSAPAGAAPTGAAQIRDAMRAGKISRGEAIRQLQALGYQ